jgi:hypothetical protein
VIGPGCPECLGAFHARPADEHILNDVVQTVADVKDVGHIGRRHYDRERFPIAAEAR